MQGTVKFYREDKGYGFIETDDNEKDIFFHRSELKTEYVKQNDVVNFDTKEGDKGPVAINVTLAEGE